MSDGKTRRFEVLHSPHHDLVQGISWEPGEVIESDKELALAFPCKFKELGVTKDVTKKGADREKGVVGIENDSNTAKKHKKGTGEDSDEKEQKPIGIEEEEEEEEDDGDGEVDDGTEDDGTEKAKSKLGKDVSGDFESAVKADLKVFKKKGKKGFVVADADEPDKALSKKPLADKKAVEKFVSDYRKG